MSRQNETAPAISSDQVPLLRRNIGHADNRLLQRTGLCPPAKNEP
jgi:hypothetical protein